MKRLWKTINNKILGLGHYFHLKHEYSGRSILILVLLCISGWLAAFHYYQITTVVPLISNEVLAQQTLAQTSVSATWQTIEVKPGDSLQHIFKRVNLTNQDLMNILTLEKNSKLFANLKPGQKIRFLISSDQELQQLVFPMNEKTNITIIRTDSGFAVENPDNNNVITPELPLPPLQKQITNQLAAINPNFNYGYATVQRSLFDAGIQAGLSHSQAMQLVTLFSQNSSLARNIRRGDQLSVLYPKIPARYISFAQLMHHQKTYQIFRFTDADGNSDYYTNEGLNLHPPIMRAPLSYSRISSLFSAHRWNPILHFVRPHYGVDYAAPMGTPVKAAGDGRIAFIGEENGYGKVIKIKHLSPYETVYAHLSHFARNIHDGLHVHQGEVIGYVGDTGESTGSHLHFEIRVNNIPHNPLTVNLPLGTPLPESQRPRFLAMKKELLNQFDLHEEKTQLATTVPAKPPVKNT